MSENGDDVVAAVPEQVEEEAPAAPEPLTPHQALREVLKRALVHDGLARGLHEAVRALDRKTAHLCVLASDCDEPEYTRLVEALCADHEINLLKVPSAKELGEFAGLCKLDAEGNARKVVAASCVVIKDYGEHSEALDVLLEYLKKDQKE